MAVDPQSPNGSGQIRGVLEARRRQLSEELDRLTTRIREHGSKPILRPDSSEVDTSDLDTALESCDVLVVLVDHDLFRSVPLAERAGKAVYDTRGIWPDQPATPSNEPLRMAG